MASQQLLLRLPDELVRRLKRRVPARQRSDFVRGLLERALPPDDDSDPLYQAALATERDGRLSVEMAEWDVTLEDGLEAPPTGSAVRRR